MKPEELQKLALDRHKQNADSWYNYVIKSIESRAENGHFEWTSSEFYTDGSFKQLGQNNKKEVDRVIEQLKSLGLKVKVEGDKILISWKI